ncbi:unnamed protein product [Arabis nemorensis]|uniref:Uncharacterized protein n=1 Tax=Arabis nemorensis TaxID=586526 RepID=A0A565BEC5_9BRAS|nr:unnamed protein product [Arabis nemorensis]
MGNQEKEEKEQGVVSTTSQSSQEKFQKTSWTKVVQSKPVLARHDFNYKEIDGTPVVEIPDDVID